MSKELNSKDQDAVTGQAVATVIEACIHYAMYLALSPESKIDINVQESMDTMSTILAHIAPIMETPFRQYMVDEWHRQIDRMEDQASENDVTRKQWVDMKNIILNKDLKERDKWLN